MRRRDEERPFSVMLDVVAPFAGFLIGLFVWLAFISALEAQGCWFATGGP
jgi:hypothetical protein